MKYIKTYENEEGHVVRGHGIKFSDFGTRRRNSITVHEIEGGLSIPVYPTDELTRLMHLGLVIYNQEEKRFEFKKSDLKQIKDEIELIKTAIKYNL